MEVTSKKIHRMGSRNYPVDSADLKSFPTLEPAIYGLGTDASGQMFASPVSNFVLPPKLYGEVPGRCDRILNTYKERKNKNTGVVLYGDKGSGKTLLAKQIMLEATKQGIPSILVTSDIETPRIIWFINNLNGPKIVMFDEFEKNYRSSSAQEEWLSLFDGTGSLDTLFLLTTNSPDLSNYLDNRPGRIFYKIGYKGLEIPVIKSFVDENIKPSLRDKGEKIKNLASLFNERFNFDMLAAWVEEVNQYEESPLDALRYLNISSFFDTIQVSIKVIVDGVEWKSENVSYEPNFDFTIINDENNEESVCLRRTQKDDWEFGIYYKDCEIIKANYAKREFILETNDPNLGKVRLEISQVQRETKHPWAQFLDQVTA